MNSRMRNRAFSLVELIVVVVIIGILAAIAIPRFSRGAAGAGDASLRSNLSILRSAIEMYYYEHGEYPGKNGDGTNAAETEAAVIAQLTQFTSEDGVASTTKDSTHRFGPYLRTGIPPCPVSPRLGKIGLHIVTGSTAPAFTSSAADAGWILNVDSGDIVANSDVTDSDGTRYDAY